MMGFGFLGMFLFRGVLFALLVGGIILVFRQTAGIRLSCASPHGGSGDGGPTQRVRCDRWIAERGRINCATYKLHWH